MGIDTCEPVEYLTSIKNPTIGRSNRSSFFKKPKISVTPSISMFKKVNCVFKSSIFTPLNFFRKIAHSTAISGCRLSNFSTVNLRFFPYVVSKCAEFYPHFKYNVLFLIGLFYERCYKINFFLAYFPKLRSREAQKRKH